MNACPLLKDDRARPMVRDMRTLPSLAGPALAVTAAALALRVNPPLAHAESTRGCALTSGYAPYTLSVRGMECRSGLRVVHKLFHDHPNADGLGFNVPGHFTTTGRTGRLPNHVRRFSCAVRYGLGT